MPNSIRPGEIPSPIDPARVPGDARVVFIGRARTSWRTREECPKNLQEARDRGGEAHLEIDEPWRAGLRDLSAAEAVIVLTWFDRARRDLLVQAPRHRETPAGVFSIRSPVRPNPIGVHVVRLLTCDAGMGVLRVDALDCLDRTPLLDLKPWRIKVDVPPPSIG